MVSIKTNQWFYCWLDFFFLLLLSLSQQMKWQNQWKENLFNNNILSEAVDKKGKKNVKHVLWGEGGWNRLYAVLKKKWYYHHYFFFFSEEVMTTGIYGIEKKNVFKGMKSVFRKKYVWNLIISKFVVAVFATKNFVKFSFAILESTFFSHKKCHRHFLNKTKMENLLFALTKREENSCWTFWWEQLGI